MNHIRGKGGILEKEMVSTVGRAGTLAGGISSSGGGGGGGISQRQLAVVEVKLQVSFYAYRYLIRSYITLHV